MKKIRITSGQFNGQIFEIEDYLYIGDDNKLWNSNTHRAEALPGDLVTYETREQMEIEGRRGMFIGHKSEIIYEPTNYQMCYSKGMWDSEPHGHCWSTDEIWGAKVRYNRENTAEYV